MRFSKYAALVLSAAISFSASAQTKLFTMAEATNGMATTLAPKGLKQASWQPGSNTLYQVVKANGQDVWIATSFPKGNTDTILRLNELNRSVYSKDKYKSLPQLKWVDANTVYYQDGNDIYRGVKTSNGYAFSNWFALPDNAENVTVDKYMNIAYTVNNNLWLVDKNKRRMQVTDDKDENVVNGQSVHRNEFGIDGGIFLSPMGNYLAYYKMDQRMVNNYPVIDWSAEPAKVKEIKYPMAGGTSHQVVLNVYNPRTGKTIALNTEGPKDQYLTSVTWSPDESNIYVAVLNRDQNQLWLNKYDAQTGMKVKTLFEEQSDKYVEPQNSLTFVGKDKFVWWSQRDGYAHLYLYNTEGKLIRQLTKGNWIVNELIGVNEKENELIITASKESPLEKHAYTVNWNNGKLNRLDKEAGFHNIMASEDGKYILDVYSSASVPKVSIVRAVNGSYSNTLMTAENTLKDYLRPEIKSVTLTADDGTPLYGKLILPTNFDKNKKYPTIVYLYNGPHVQLVKNSFPESGNLWYEYMAQHGYIIFTMDGRGSSNRGLKFEQATFRNLGQTEMNDQLKGVEYLKSLPYVDSKRMGVHGWSFGGFMTTSLMLHHPGVFKTAVAGGPVMDWKMYEVMYTERYMDTPQDNPQGYATSALFDKVKNLDGKLLLIHGTDDDVVVWQHSLYFLKKAVAEGVQIDYFVYPGHQHNVRGKDRVHLMQKITDYFDQNLK
jgi:dipeptidyl-peptidase-4